MMMYTNCILFLLNIHLLYADLSSYIDLYSSGKDFIPANPVQLLGIHSPIASAFDCAFLCHQDPRCRTFVFDLSSCRLYEGSSDTGFIIVSPSTSRIVGGINYDKIHVASAYNQSCDHCYPDRYLVCRDDTCQCPLNTFWDGESKCINQLFVDSTLTCKNDDWCRQDMNMTCQCGKCQCPIQTFWNNKTCAPKLLVGAHCNISDQCRNDLNLTCSRTKKICTPMSVVRIPVVNGTLPSKFSQLPIILNASGSEWWRAFDNNTYTDWNAFSTTVLDYLLVTFDDVHLLNSLELTVYGDMLHDPKTIDVYLDEEATCLAQSFSFPVINNYSYLTFASSPFSNTRQLLVTKQVMLAIERWSGNQVWLFELAFFGGLY